MSLLAVAVILLVACTDPVPATTEAPAPSATPTAPAMAQPSDTPEPTATPTATETASATPTPTASATATPTSTATATATATLGIGSTRVITFPSIVENEVVTVNIMFIPGGPSIMGTNTLQITEAETPQIVVNVPQFFMQETETTVTMYSACAKEQECPLPGLDFAMNPLIAGGFPVVGINYYNAESFCSWMGGYLPTEEQWEKAGRGTDGRIYPWGNNAPFNDLANVCDKQCTEDWANTSIDDGYGELSPVGIYPQGASIYGVLDMVGGVREWVAGNFDHDKYRGGGTPNGNSIVRGGSWGNSEADQRLMRRNQQDPRVRNNYTGFRCAFDA